MKNFQGFEFLEDFFWFKAIIRMSVSLLLRNPSPSEREETPRENLLQALETTEIKEWEAREITTQRSQFKRRRGGK